MKAIILAAGVGSRLRPITNNKPKTMVNVNGKPMIAYIVDAILSASIIEIVVCTGYRAEQIEKFLKETYPTAQFSFVNNSAYETTNNMFSLYLARKHLKGDIILMNADLVFDKTIIQDLVKQDGCVIPVDKGLFQQESMKLLVENNEVRHISKNISEKDSYGCSIDIYKLDNKATNVMNIQIKRIIEEEEELNQWTEVLLDRIISEELINAIPYNINGRKWYEVDDFQDLALAEIILNEKLPNLKDKTTYILDKDGTLVIGQTEIENASNFINHLIKKGKKWVVGSNNSSKTANEHSKYLKSILKKVEQIPVISSLDMAISYLKNKGVKNLYWVANSSVSEELSNFFQFDDNQPDATLLTYDNQINFQKILKLIHFIRQNIPYYATHIDIVCPTEKGDIPDIGSFIELIHTSTKVKPLKTFGR